MRLSLAIVASLALLLGGSPVFATGHKPDPDLKTLKELKRYGVDLAQPQPVTFQMLVPTRIQDAAARRLQQAGFETDSAWADDLTVYLHATKTMVPDLAVLRQVRRDLNSLLSTLLKPGERGSYNYWNIPHETPPFQGDVKATGLWVEGDRFFLFAEIWDRPCPNAPFSGGSYPQLYVSKDKGRTWARRGPPMNGNEFTLLSEKDGKIWIAGYHTAEDNSDPFLFLPAQSGDHWQLQVFYHETAGLDRMAWTSDGQLVAWVEHIDPAVMTEGPSYIHHSRDGGRTWKILGLARKHPVTVDAEFKKISTQMDPLWRALNFEDPGGVVQHRDSETAPWKTVAHFPPAPPCPK